MTRILALWERHYARVTKRRNATHHRPYPRTSGAVSTRRKP